MADPSPPGGTAQGKRRQSIVFQEFDRRLHQRLAEVAMVVGSRGRSFLRFCASGHLDNVRNEAIFTLTRWLCPPVPTLRTPLPVFLRPGVSNMFGSHRVQTMDPSCRPVVRVQTRGLLLAGLAVFASGAGATGLGDFTGRWAYDSTRSDRIEDAIETCIASYPEDAKATTRDRLLETNELTRVLVVSPLDSGKKVLIGYEVANNGTVAPLDGTEVPSINSSGEVFQMSVRLDGEAMVETFEADNGTRTNTYSVSADGKALVLQATVESPQMPTVLRYRLEYIRATNTAVQPTAGRRIGSRRDEQEPRRVDGAVLRIRTARSLGQVAVHPGR